MTLPGIPVAQQRLANQHLLGPRFASLEEAIRCLVAVQSQDYNGAKWGLAQRTTGLDSAALDELFAQGKLLRTHVMRPTWHFVLPEDIRWLQMLTAPRVRPILAPYDRKLELDKALISRAQTLFTQSLQGGKQLTRAELAAVLAAHGIEASGQRLGHLVMHAELDAVLCSGGLKGKQFTYALLAERAPHARVLEPDQALAELAGRYFAGHGPATVHDFAWWSGLTVTVAKKGLEMSKARLAQETIDGQTYWFDRSQPAVVSGSSLFLLPNYDEFLIAYKGYGAIFDAAHLPANAVDALRAHIIVRNGQVVGGWRRTVARSQVVLTMNVLVKLTKAEQAALKAAARWYGQFLGLPAVVMFS